jgi:hypothetical protein
LSLFCPRSVAGEAKGMARIVRAIVNGHIAGKADATNQEQPEKQGCDAGNETLGQSEGRDGRQLDRGIHVLTPSVCTMRMGSTPGFPVCRVSNRKSASDFS